MAKTTSTAKAVERLARHFPAITTQRMVRGTHKGQYRMAIKRDGDGAMFRRPAKALSWLADLARHRGDADAIRDAVDYATPNLPRSGQAAWEMAALEWLAGTETPPQRRRRA